MATPTSATSQVVRFGVFELDLHAGELRKSGVKVKLEGQPLTILMLLLERPGQVVTREELKQKLWPAETFVDFEHSINVAVKRLRAALQDSATAPRLIETLPRRGYRFIYPLNGAAVETPATAPRRKRRWTILSLVVILLPLVAVVLLANVARVREHLFGRPAIKRIAVLPLRPLSPDPAQADLAAGFTEMLITELGSLAGPEVISHQSVLRYAGSNEPIGAIAAELDVDGVIEGTFLRTGNTARVTLNFIQVSPERHLFAGEFPCEIGNVFAAQRQVATDAAKHIRWQASPEQLRRPPPRAVASEVAEAYFRGLAYFRKGTLQDRHKAAELFQQAIAADPQFAPGYASLALLYTHGGAGRQGDGRGRNRTLAREWAQKALQLDPVLAEAHTALAWTELGDRNWRAAEQEFERAITLNPNFTTARTWYAQYLAAVGRAEEAVAQAEVVLRLDPVSPPNVTHAAWALMAAGRVDDAMRQLRAIVDLDPSYFWAHKFLADAYLRKDMAREAVRELEKAARLSHPDIQPLGSLAYAYASSGQRAEAEKIARDLDVRARQALAQDQWIAPNIMVPAYLALGDKDKAFAYLEKALQRNAASLVFLNAEETYRPLRGDPRFQDIVHRLGLPAANGGR